MANSTTAFANTSEQPYNVGDSITSYDNRRARHTHFVCVTFFASMYVVLAYLRLSGSQKSYRKESKALRRRRGGSQSTSRIASCVCNIMSISCHGHRYVAVDTYVLRMFMAGCSKETVGSVRMSFSGFPLSRSIFH